jgi:hypothetical protein
MDVQKISGLTQSISLNLSLLFYWLQLFAYNLIIFVVYALSALLLLCFLKLITF